MKSIYCTLILLIVLVFSVSESHASEGDIWLTPVNVQGITASKSFDIEIHMDTGGKNIGAFNMFLDVNSNDVTIETLKGTNGLSAGTDTISYMILANAGDIANGHYRFAGISAMNYASGNDVHLLTIHFKSSSTFTSGISNLSLRFNELTDELGMALTLGTLTDATVNSDRAQTPLYRLFNKRTGAHLYTRGEVDRDKILSKWSDFEFTDGGPAFYASLTDDGTTPIFRLYNTRTGVHLYTKGVEDRDKILSKWSDFEFTDGGPAFYAKS